MQDQRCPLCGARSHPYHSDGCRPYLECRECSLVFVPPKHHLDLQQEKKEYDLHENSLDDLGYQRFLSRLSEPLLERLDKGKRGLDFGCGPAPVLSQLLERGGQHMTLYDPFYYNDPAVLKASYDFVCATEVVEHFRKPQKEFRLLFDLLEPGGWLGIMTKLVRDKNAFSTWHYIRDLTHVAFYSRTVFYFIADLYKANVSFVGNDVILMQKKQDSE